jgi:hypothetical protein
MKPTKGDALKKKPLLSIGRRKPLPVRRLVALRLADLPTASCEPLKPRVPKLRGI